MKSSDAFKWRSLCAVCLCESAIFVDGTVVQSPGLFFLLLYFVLFWFDFYVWATMLNVESTPLISIQRVLWISMKRDIVDERTHVNSIQMLNEIKYWFFPVVVADDIFIIGITISTLFNLNILSQWFAYIIIEEPLNWLLFRQL